MANAQRQDVVRALREFILKTEAGFGEHTPDTQTEAPLLAKLERCRQLVNETKAGWYGKLLEELEL